MKKLTITAIILLTVLITKAQDTLKIPLKDGKIYYEQTADVPNMTKDKLFKNAKLWYIDNFRDSKSVLENENLSDGNITGKGNTQFTCGKGMTEQTEMAYFTISIDVKDDKYRVRIYDINGVGLSTYSWQDMYDKVFIKNVKLGRGMYLRYLGQFDAEMKRILQSINLAIVKDDSF